MEFVQTTNVWIDDVHAQSKQTDSMTRVGTQLIFVHVDDVIQAHTSVTSLAEKKEYFFVCNSKSNFSLANINPNCSTWRTVTHKMSRLTLYFCWHLFSWAFFGFSSKQSSRVHLKKSLLLMESKMRAFLALEWNPYLTKREARKEIGNGPDSGWMIFVRFVTCAHCNAHT